MSLTGKQKKYLKKNIRQKSLGEIVDYLGVEERQLHEYLKKLWGNKKYQRYFQKQEGSVSDGLSSRVMEFNLRAWLSANKRKLAILTIVAFLVYVNSIGNEFVSDDVVGILQNENLGNLGYILRQIVFLRGLFYFVIHGIFGKLSAIYRLLNIFFHIGTTLGVYLFLDLISQKKIAWYGALIMAVHPLATEAITWISGGVYVQYSFFLIWALIFYTLSPKGKKWTVAAIVSFILGLLSSEKAIFFPFLLVVFELVFGSLKKNWPRLIPYFVLGGALGIFYMIKIPQRLESLDSGGRTAASGSTFNPLIQIPVAISSYLGLFAWPIKLTLYHSEMSFSQGQFLLYLLGFIGYLGSLGWSYKKNKEIFFYLSLFLISLLPTLTPFGISWIVAERYVYFGLIGLVGVVGYAVASWIDFPEKREIALTVLYLVVVLLGGRTIIRNIDWKNQDNLWLGAAKTSPSSPQNHNNLGDYYSRQGDLGKAIEEFQKAITLKPGYADAYHNLANAYQQKGEFDLAITNYQEAIKYNPTLWQSHQNLAAIYLHQQDLDLALDHMQKATEIAPNNSNLHVNLAILYLELDQNEEAKQHLEMGLQLDPNNQSAKALLGEIKK
jgi:tetratricopeptide (TPR) repeat protein